MATPFYVWRRYWDDRIFSTSDFAQWNNNFESLHAYSQTGALALKRIIVDFSVRVTLEDEISALQWQPDALEDMTILAGAQWSPDGSDFTPDLKTLDDVPLLLTQALPMTDRWEFTNASTGGHAQMARWQTVEPLQYDSFRKVPDSTAGAAVNFGILPYFAQSIATEGDVFSLRVTTWARTLWQAIP